MELKGKKINFLGDSITEGMGCSDESKVYHQLIKNKYGLSEARNYGVSGTRIAKQIVPTVSNPVMDRYFALRAAEMDKDADVITVFGGTNDYGHGDAPVGESSDRTPDTFYGALHDLYSYLISKYPGKPIFVLTPTHRDNENVPDSNGLRLCDYVKIIREVAEYYSLPVIDLYAMSGIQPEIKEIKERYMPDGLHPNDAGQALLAERIANFILSY